MKKPGQLFLFLVLIFCSCSAYSASFDCSKAKSIPEYLICNTPDLSQADDELKPLYEAAKSKAEDKQAFREQTRIRWNEREKNCRDVTCVRNWYATQIAFYSSLLGLPVPQQAAKSAAMSSTAPSNAASNKIPITQAFTCRAVADCPYFSDFYMASLDFQRNLKTAVNGVQRQFPDWIPNGTVTPMTPIFVDGQVATIGSICEPHNCPHQIISLFYRDSKRLVGMFMDDDTNGVWLGNPSEGEKIILRTYFSKPDSVKIGQNFTAESSNKSQKAQPQSGEMPRIEASFISHVATAQQNSEDAKNDMQRGGIKAQRDKEICQSMASLQIKNWIGSVNKIDANSDGKGVFSVEIAKNIFISTWNNALSDMNEETLIEPGTAVFNVASSLHKGQKVVFSGTFFRGDGTDCIDEQSLTLEGKLQEPEFVFRFSEISPM